MRSLLALLVAIGALAGPAAAGAATIVVDTTEPLSTTECGLANAITAANTNGVSGGCRGGSFGAPDRIEFELPPRATIMLGAALPTILGQLEIVGPGAEQLVVSGGDESRVFTVAATEASITGLTVADGKAEFGGGVLNQPGSTLELAAVTLNGNEASGIGGGAIRNEGVLALTESVVSENVAVSNGTAVGGGISNWTGTMTITRSTVDGNEAVTTGPLATVVGGGIFSNGALTIRESTVSHNRAATPLSPGPNFSEGGGIALDGSGATAIERSTIAFNAAVGPANGLIRGGGFAVFSSGPQSIIASTVAANSAPIGANLYIDTAISFRSSIVAAPLGGGGSCEEAGISLGFNLDEGGSCGFSQPSDQANVDPLLAPGLAANGGPTETFALLPGSPALDRGLAAPGEAADQRGLRRPLLLAGVASAPGGNGADVGAYELQAPRAAIIRGPGEGETIANPEPSFEFVADEAAAGFLCTLDGGQALPCASPFTPPRLADGPHTFAVGAVGANGYGQPAATRDFTVATRQPEPHHDAPAPPAPEKPAAAVRAAAPVAAIAGLPARTTQRRLTIRFSADQAGSTFSCRLDGRPWRGCRSPYRTPRLALGRHTFRLKATGPSGVAGPTAVVKSFRVVASPRRR